MSGQWSTYVFALPGRERGPLAIGTGTSRQAAGLDALERLSRRSPGSHDAQVQDLRALLLAETASMAGQREDVRRWFEGSAACGTDGQPLVVYRQAAVPEGGEPVADHFGPIEYALGAAAQPAGGPVAAHLRIRNPARLADDGAWEPFDVAAKLRQAGLITADLFARIASWSTAAVPSPWNPWGALRGALALRGIDGLVYEHRLASGRPSGAGTCWIALDPQQVRVVEPSAPVNEIRMHMAILRLARSDDLWHRLLSSQACAGPREGGSLVLAEALIIAAGRGELVHVSGGEQGAERYAARIDGVIYDCSGSSTSHDEWVDRVVVESSASHRSERFVFGVGRMSGCTMVRDVDASLDIAGTLREWYLPEAGAWEVPPPPAVPQAAVVHEQPGRYGGALQAFASTETRAVADFLCKDKHSLMRLRAAGAQGDVMRTWMLTHVPAQLLARQLGFHPALIDWTQVTEQLLSACQAQAQSQAERFEAEPQPLPQRDRMRA